MSAKRPAQYELDEKTLEAKNPDQEVNQSSQANESSETQKQRTILAVKKDTDEQKPTEKVEEKKPEATKPSLFTGLFTNNSQTLPLNGSGLFTTNSSSIFSSNSTGLFSNNGTTSKPTGGLFGSSSQISQPKTGGLFSSNGTSGGSIFNFQSTGVPPIKNSGSLFGGPSAQGNDEDDSGDSAELEAAQNLDVDPSKSTSTYKYEETCVLVLKQKAFKFKKIGSDLIENVDVVITHDKGSQLYYISIQLPATKKNIYSGVIIQKKSQVKHLNNKKENVEISAFNILKGKPEQAVLRCQFEKEDQGVSLHDTVDQIIKGTYVLEVKKDETAEKTEEKAKTEEAKKEEKESTETKKQQN